MTISPRKLASSAKFTMQASFYPDVFSRHGISLAVPNVEEQDYIHEKYFGELVHGTVLPETRRRLEDIVESMKPRNAIEGLIVGGTELSLIFREPQSAAPCIRHHTDSRGSRHRPHVDVIS